MTDDFLQEVRIIQAAIDGDVEAFNQLVLTYQSAVYNTALRIMNDELLADDLTQTAFINAWRHMDGFKGTAFKPWILRITVNACYDELRKIRRHPSVPLEPVSQEDDQEFEDSQWMIDPSMTPPEHAEQKDVMEKVRECMEQLSDDYRMVLYLIDVQEQNYQDVADMINKPLGTVKSRLLRARLKMRDCLKSKGELSGGEQR